MTRHVAVYHLRGTGRSKDSAGQEPSLKRWAAGQSGAVVWYRDRTVGALDARPGWDRLLEALRAGAVRAVVAWRVSMLRLSLREWAAFLDELRERNVDLFILEDEFRLSSAAGRRTARFLESVARAETAIRTDRIVAGQAAARNRGGTLGRPVGSGKPIKVTPAQEARVRRLKAAGQKIAAIARTVELSRPTVYSILEREDAGPADHVARSHHARSRGLAGDARRGL